MKYRIINRLQDDVVTGWLDEGETLRFLKGAAEISMLTNYSVEVYENDPRKVEGFVHPETLHGDVALTRLRNR